MKILNLQTVFLATILFLTLCHCFSIKYSPHRFKRTLERLFSRFQSLGKEMAEARNDQRKHNKSISNELERTEEKSTVLNSIMGYVQETALESVIARVPKLDPKKQNFQNTSNNVRELLSKVLGDMAVKSAVARRPGIEISNRTYEYAQKIVNNTLQLVPMLRPVDILVSNGTDSVYTLATFFYKLPYYTFLIIIVASAIGLFKLIWIYFMVCTMIRKANVKSGKIECKMNIGVNDKYTYLNN